MTTTCLRGMTVSAVAIVLGLAVGCAPRAATTAAPTATTAAAHAHNPSDHNHARGKMLMASDGRVDAMLTAHLSRRDGNELDIFVEEKGQPKALAVTTLTAKARVGEEVRSLAFACAPANERPASEVEGTCSHFVAPAPFMTPGVMLRVESALPVDGDVIAMTWRDFEARRYAHHEE